MMLLRAILCFGFSLVGDRRHRDADHRFIPGCGSRRSTSTLFHLRDLHRRGRWATRRNDHLYLTADLGIDARRAHASLLRS